MIYVDGGEFVFEDRSDIKKGTTLLSDHFAQFGLKMHIGTKKTLKYRMCILPTSRFLQRTNFTSY